MVGEALLPLLVPIAIYELPAHPSTSSSICPLPADPATCPATHPPHPPNCLPTNSVPYPSSSHPLSCQLRLLFTYSSTCSPNQIPIYLLARLPTCQSHPFILPIYSSTDPSLQLPAHWYIHLPTYPFIYPLSSHLSIYPLPLHSATQF